MKQSYRRVLPYVLRQWRALAGVALFTLAASGAAALQPWPLKILVDYALKREPIPGILHSALAGVGLPETAGSLVILAAVATAALFLVNGTVDTGLTLTWTLAGQRMVRDLSIDLFRSLQRVPLSEHFRRPVGDSLSRLNADAWCVYSLTDVLLTPGQHVVQLLTLGLVAWRLDARLAMITLILSPILAGSAFWFGRLLKQRARLTREAQSQFLSFVHQTLTAIPIVQAFSTELTNRRYLGDLASEAVALSQRGAVVNSAYGFVNGLVLSAGMAVILYTGGLRVLAGTLPLGSLLIFLAYVKSMQDATAGLIKTYATFKPVEASLERVVEVLAPPDSPADNARDRKQVLACSQASLAFENVTFRYREDAPVLKNVTLRAQPGEKIAIVGPSGAGKSTLASLILRFFDPCSGRITINGVDTREYTVESLRAAIAIVLQEPFLIAASIRDNIAYGKPDATIEEVQAAAEAAGAHAFIRRLPNGYDTIIGEHGSTLSGGEGQRLAIARAILKNAPLLILDEPTAALDSATESDILNALDRLIQGKTGIIIAHRPSTIRGADRVFRLRDGALAEISAGEARS